jgi:hypothetical protein
VKRFVMYILSGFALIFLGEPFLQGTVDAVSVVAGAR